MKASLRLTAESRSQQHTASFHFLILRLLGNCLKILWTQAVAEVITFIGGESESSFESSPE